MKNKFITILFIILIIIMFPLRLLNKTYFQTYNNILWIIVIITTTITSIYLTIKLKFKHYNPINLQKSIKGNNINSLCISLGAKIGVGSISGIALAIYLAGPGVIFWLWLSSILFSVLTYCEAYLGVTYQKGAFNYIKKGLHNPILSLIYATILIISYVIGFIGIQSNTIIKSLSHITHLNPLPLVIILAIIIFLIIFNSIDKVLNFITKLVPIMCFLYILLGIIIIYLQLDQIKPILLLILKDALTIKTTTISIIITGIQKSIFATESGIGTTSIASAIKKDNPSKEALFQVTGVYFTSLIICTITAIVILTNDYQIFIKNINGVELVMNAFSHHLGHIGVIFLLITIILFAISTIISGYYYGISTLKYLNPKLSPNTIYQFKILIIIITIIGGLINSSIIWSIIDTLVLFLLLINIYTIIKLHKKIH